MYSTILHSWMCSMIGLLIHLPMYIHMCVVHVSVCVVCVYVCVLCVYVLCVCECVYVNVCVCCVSHTTLYTIN